MKLTPTELLEISQEISLAFAPDFSIKKPEPAAQQTLSAQEMLEISDEIRQDFAPKASDNTQELVLLPVDPEHLHAYWNMGDGNLNTAPKNAAVPQLTLRVYPASDKNADTTKTKSWFDVAVAGSQSQQNVFLSMQTQATAYRATLGNRYQDNSLAPLAYSNVTSVPRGKARPNPVKDSQPLFNAMPPFVMASRGIACYKNNSASGQRINE